MQLRMYVSRADGGCNRIESSDWLNSWLTKESQIASSYIAKLCKMKIWHDKHTRTVKEFIISY